METAPSEETSAIPQPTDTSNFNHAKVSVIMDDIEAAATKLDLKLVTFTDKTILILNSYHNLFLGHSFVSGISIFQAMETSNSSGISRKNSFIDIESVLS